MVKKNTSQGNESYHKTEVESGTQTNFIYNNIYVKNDLFEAFYEDYLEYTSIPKDDTLHRIEKENITEHSKKVKSLQNQIEELKKE